MNLKEKKVFNLIIIIIVVIFLIQYNGSKRETFLKNNYVLTIGKTIKYTYAGEYEDYIKYIYIVDSLKYVGYAERDYKMSSPLKKYYKVKYSKIKPEISEMYLTQEVTDSIQIVKAGFKYKTK